MPSNLITPNMFLTEPAIGNSLSPQWSQLLNADLGIIDQHNHSPGSGVQIPPEGLDINSDLTFQGNNLLALNSAVFNGAVTGTPDELSIFSDGTDFFFKDINGNSIQLTANGQPNTSTGNIQGLPSTPTGGAGIAWINAQSTFRFTQDNGTAGANIEVGSLVIRYPGSYPTPTGNYILLEAPSTLATGYSLTLPATLPGSQSLLTVDGAGAMANVAPDGSTIVIASSTLKVPTGGITSTELATNSVTTAKIADSNVTNAKLATSNATNTSNISSFSTGSGSPTQVTGSALTLTVTGHRSVILNVQGIIGGFLNAGAAGAGAFAGRFQIIRNPNTTNTVVADISVAGNGSENTAIKAPSSSLWGIDNPPAGSHDYYIYIFCSTNCNTVSVSNVALYAVEL